MGWDQRNQETEEELRAKKQKHLRAIIIGLDAKPVWFEGRLCEETGLGLPELGVVMAPTQGCVLSLQELDRVEMFLRAFKAGGITAIKGEKVPVEVEPLSRIDGFSVSVPAEPKRSARHKAPAHLLAPKPQPVELAPEVRAARRVLVTRPPVVTKSPERSRPAVVAVAVDEEKAISVNHVVRRYKALPKPYGFCRYFEALAGICTSSVAVLNSGGTLSVPTMRRVEAAVQHLEERPFRTQDRHAAVRTPRVSINLSATPDIDASPASEEREAVLLLDGGGQRKVRIVTPPTVTAAELARIQAWVGVQLCVE
jgi:hypothetical protein